MKVIKYMALKGIIKFRKCDCFQNGLLVHHIRIEKISNAPYKRFNAEY